MAPSSKSRRSRNYAVVAYAATVTGALFLVMSSVTAKHSPVEWLDLLSSEIGMALVAIGGAHIIYDKLLREESEERLLAGLHTAALWNGLRLVDTERTHSGIYQRWAIEPELKEISIIGRSVLHRMNAWANEIFHKPIEAVILGKVQRGARFIILFLDPRMPIIEQLMAEEGHNSTMRADLTKSLEICADLAFLIKRQMGSPKHLKGSIRIAVCKKNPTFAFHKQGDQILIGFYPLNMKGNKSPVYEAVGKDIADSFENHFWLLDRDSETTTLISYDGEKGPTILNTDRIAELLNLLKGSSSSVAEAAGQAAHTR